MKVLTVGGTEIVCHLMKAYSQCMTRLSISIRGGRGDSDD